MNLAQSAEAVGRTRPVLRLLDISRRFGSYVALKPSTIEVEEGEFFSLLGPSGCGKTTTLRIVAGFEIPDTGTVELAGRDVTRVAPNRRDTNTVFQSYALFPHMTVAENVAYPLRMKGVGRNEMENRTREAIDRVSMTDFAGRLPHEMSGGQRQRIALARAIVGRPRVLLLDEPLGALDLKLREQMQHVLVELQKSLGITFVYVTHDQGEALSMSDRIAVMKSGRIQQIGTPEEVYYQPANAFVADFIGKSNRLEVAFDPATGCLRCGAIAIPATGPPRPQSVRSVAIRHESLRVEPQEHCDVTFDARIRSVMFLGSVIEMMLDADGQILTSHVPTRRGRTMKAGDTVRVGLSLDDLVYFDA